MLDRPGAVRRFVKLSAPARSMGRVKPVIAIGAYPRTIETAYGPTLLHTVSRHYVQAVERAGGAPVVLPVTEPDDVADVLRIADGVVLTGGGDIQPSLYGDAPHDSTRGVNAERDAFEVALLSQAIAADVPLLAICRGMQLMNVAMGGSLVQDVFSVTGQFHDEDKRAHELVHRVKIEPGSHLAATLGVVELSVNSVHHQGVGRLADDLRAVAWAEDGSIEGVELPGGRFALGVQWHPEMLEDQPEQQGLFRALVDQARRRLPA